MLARLLAPADFGLLTMVSTFSLLLMNVGLNGFTEAVLQREEIDHGLSSNVFWINAALGLLLTIGFALSGPLLARFYGDPRIARVTVAMSATIFLTSLSVQHLALLKRAMRFSVVSRNDIAARAVSVAVSIVLGWAAWGYWALVAGAVALPLATAVGAWQRVPMDPGRAGASPRHGRDGAVCRADVRAIPGRLRHQEPGQPPHRMALRTAGAGVLQEGVRPLRAPAQSAVGAAHERRGVDDEPAEA